MTDNANTDKEAKPLHHLVMPEADTANERKISILEERILGVDRALSELMLRAEEWREIGAISPSGKAVFALWALSGALSSRLRGAKLRRAQAARLRRSRARDAELDGGRQ